METVLEQAQDEWNASLHILQHQFRCGFRAPDHPRDTCSGMGAGTDKIEIVDDIVAIVHAEPGALGEQRLKTERAAEMGIEIGAEILRRIVKARDDPVMNIGDQSLADFVENAFLVDGP